VQRKASYEELNCGTLGVSPQERREGMQRSILVSIGVFTVLLFLASPALANEEFSFPVFSSEVICDTDGADPFTDTKGLVTIFDNGNLLVSIPRLLPNQVYKVVLACQVGGKLVFEDRSTNSRGRLLALIPGLGRSGPLATGCALPTVNLFPVSDPQLPGFCYTGYGQP
jgi:hypothetical protein